MRIGMTGQMVGGGELPYERVDSLYSDGYAWTIIPHFHTTSNKCRVVAEFDILGTQNFCNPFQGAVNDANFLSGCYEAYDLIFFHSGGGSSSFNASQSVGHVSYSCLFEDGVQTLTYNGTQYVKSVGGSCASACMGIFVQTNGSAKYSANVCHNIAIESFMYYDGDTLIANLIPCREKETSVLCFYNSVDRTFLKPKSGGYFLVYALT